MNLLPDDIIDIIYSYAKELKNCNKQYNRLHNRFKISDNKNINSQLEYIAKMKNCSYLYISSCNYIDKYGYESIYTMNNLCELNASALSITNEYLQHICYYNTNLKKLNLSNCIQLTNDGFKYINNLKNIEILNISNCLVKTAAFKYISKLPKLTILITKNALITVKSVYYIGQMKMLTSINCDGSLVDKTIMFTNINHISLVNCKIFDDCQNDNLDRNLSCNTKILILNGSDINIKTFIKISKCCNIQMLSIVNCKNLTINVFSYIANMQMLKYLMIYGNTQFAGYKYHLLNKIKTIIVDITFFTEDNYCKKCHIANQPNKSIMSINNCKY
jgi:hypothetical protein